MGSAEAISKKFFDSVEMELRKYERLGEQDGKLDKPSASQNQLGSGEAEILSRIQDVWLAYKSANAADETALKNELEKTKAEIDNDISVTLDKIQDDRSAEEAALEFQYGKSTAEYQFLRDDLERKERVLANLQNLLNRPLAVHFTGYYLALMVVLAIAEVPVNRLAFELFFEQSPLISLVLSAAIGSLFIFFAHVIGMQLKRAQCAEINPDKPKIYLVLGSIGLVAVVVMYFLGVMREQLVAVQAASNLDLEALLNASTESTVSAEFKMSLGSKGFFLVLINLAIFITGVIAAYFRHDPHPDYEKALRDEIHARKKFLNYQKQYEEKQVELLRDYNQKHSYNKTNQRHREALIESIVRKREQLRSECETVRDRLISTGSRFVVAYREANLKARLSEAPPYFKNNSDQIFIERLK